MNNSFITDLAMEVDGVTNGVIISLLQAMPESNLDNGTLEEMLNAGGVFFDDSKKNYSDAKGTDNYEKLSKIWSQTFNEITNPALDLHAYPEIEEALTRDYYPLELNKTTLSEEALTLLDELVGNMQDEDGEISSIGRKLAKDPLMTNNYGAGVAKIKNILINTVINNFYKKLEEAHALGKDAEQEFINKFNYALGSSFRIQDGETALTTRLSKADTKKLHELILSTHGMALEVALKVQLKGLSEFRETITQATLAMYHIFNTHWEAFLKEKSGNKVLSNKEKIELMRSNEFKSLLPTIKGPLSEGILDGVLMLKTKQFRDTNNNKKRQQVKFTKKISGTDSASATTTMADTIYGEPGVKSSAVMTQSIDSGTMISVMDAFGILNIHDAIMLDLDTIAAGAQALNESFREVNENYNMLEEVNNTLQRMIQASKKMDAGLHAKAMQTIKDDKGVPEGFSVSINEEVSANKNRRNAYKAKYISQYAYEFAYSEAHEDHNNPEFIQPSDSKFVWEEKKPGKATKPKMVKNTRVKVYGSGTKEDIDRAFSRAAAYARARENAYPGWTVERLRDAAGRIVGFNVYRKDGLYEAPAIPNKPFIDENYTKEQQEVSDQIHNILEEEFNEEFKQNSFIEAIAKYAGQLTKLANNIRPGERGQQWLRDAKAETNMNNERVRGAIRKAVNNKQLTELQVRSRLPAEPQSPAIGTIPDVETLSADNTVDIFNKLGLEESLKGNKTEDTEHTAYLTSVLNTLVNKAIKPTDTIELNVNQDGTDTAGVWNPGEKSIYINAPITINNNSQMSAQEVYAHELVHVVTQAGLNTKKGLRKELYDLFKLAKVEFTAEDFLAKDMDGNPITHSDPIIAAEELAAAKERYDYVFNNNQTKTKIVDSTLDFQKEITTNPFLHEFVAFGMTNKHFRAKLAKIRATKKRNLAQGTLLQRLEALYKTILDWINNLVHGRKNVNADIALRILVDEIAGINHKHQNSIFRALDKVSKYQSKLSGKLNNIIFEKLNKLEKRTQGSRNIVGRSINTTLRIPTIVKSKEFRKALNNAKMRLKITEDNIFLKLMRELQGQNIGNYKFYELLRYSKHHVDQMRKHVGDNATRHVRNSFIAGKVNEDESEAIYRSLLKTDMSSISLDYTGKELGQLFSDTSFLYQVKA
jgi:hypothetical protein